MSFLKALASSSHLKGHPQPHPTPLPPHQPHPPRPQTLSRRLTVSSIAAQVLLASQAPASNAKRAAHALDLPRRIEPERTVEEAERGLRDNARALLSLKTLIESGAWSEAQRELRRSSSNMKQDLYTIIQGKPGSERPLLRKLYSDLFNSASRMDYALRDKDEDRAWQYYRNALAVLDDIFSRI